jgi:hypothetical protein
MPGRMGLPLFARSGRCSIPCAERLSPSVVGWKTFYEPKPTLKRAVAQSGKLKVWGDHSQ